MARRSERRVAWLTDIHLEFLKPPAIDRFLGAVRETGADAVLITGDIAQAPILAGLLRHMVRVLVKPVYFVLGNHDFYRGDIDPVRAEMTALTRERSGAVWLPAAGVVELASGVGLVGHDGWADGRYGHYLRSTVLLNDYVMIDSLKITDAGERLAQLQVLGDQAGDYLRGILPQAAAQYGEVFVMTHVPPFIESCWYEGRTPALDDPYLPHFTCKATGDALLAVADAHPQVRFTVLCGHVHHGGEAQVRPNLRVLTGAAEYEKPTVQRVFSFVM